MTRILPPLLLLAVTLPVWGQTPPTKQATATDLCRAKIPESVAQLLAQRFPKHRLPLLTDSADGDVEWNREHGGDGCILVGIADFNGDGRNDYAVGLAPQGEGEATVGVALSNGKGWSVSSPFAAVPPNIERLYVLTVPPGRSTRTDVRAGEPLLPNERESLKCGCSGVEVGETEAWGAVHCYVRKRWLFVVVSD